MESCSQFKTTQFAYWKGLDTVILSVFISHFTVCIVMWVARIVQIDYSTTFDMVNHQGILLKQGSVGVGDSVMTVLTYTVCRD